MRGIKKKIHRHIDLDYFVMIFNYRKSEYVREHISDRFNNPEDWYKTYLEELKAAKEEAIWSRTSFSTALHGKWYLYVNNHTFFYKEYEYDVLKARALYTDEEIQLLIYDDYDKERRRFERLKNKFSTSKEEREELKRPRIPEEIRIKVWQRDGGKCARCGSREKLEYDHIVPISKGGSNTLRNIELLCEECNRKKGNKIGG